MKLLAKLALMLVCIIYLINPGAGFVELLPDNLPFIGNLDEGAAATILVLLLQSFRKKPPLPP
jgi:uncharacterized membrane protein YkvA (DUF1232 family)